MGEFGQHLTIDASSCNNKKLTDQNWIYDILNNLPAKLNMHIMTLPHVVKWVDPGAKIPGISGFVMIAESHISIHTFPEKDYVFMDVFSCKSFDAEKAAKLLVSAFEAKKSTKKVITRGAGFPRWDATHMYPPKEEQLVTP
jgi:S-adenosylmethionine decarboxylase